MKDKKIIGVTLLSAFLISGCTNANDETTPIKDSTKSDYVSSPTTTAVVSSETKISSNTTINTESVESENYQYYPLADGTLAIAAGTNKFLESLTIPEMYHGKMVTQIADNGFANCVALKQINLPDNINIIREKAFSGCSALSTIKIPDGTSVIGNYAFEGCSSLSEVTIPSAITALGKYAFKDCTGIKNSLLPSSITIINDGTFENCPSLTNVVIPNSIVTIGEAAFKECISLTHVSIPNSVNTIGSSAFVGCSSLESAIIPASVSSIGENAFASSSLTVYCEAENQPQGWNANWAVNCKAIEWGCLGGGNTGVFNYKYDITSGSKQITITKYNGSESEVVIPDKIEGLVVSIIGAGAFEGSSSLKNVVIPNTVTSIKSKAFYNCTSLESIVVPLSVKNIESEVFGGQSSVVVFCMAENKPEQWNEAWKSENVLAEWCVLDGGRYQGFSYRIDKADGTCYATIVKYHLDASQIAIPEVINGVKVTKIVEKA